MSKFNNNKIIPRYSIIAIVMSLIALAVLGKTIYTMTANRSYWMEVAATQKKDSVKVKPTFLVVMGNSWLAHYLSSRCI